MSKSSKRSGGGVPSLIEIKSKFDAEFRRFSVNRGVATRFEDFQVLLEKLHQLNDVPFLVCYTDPEGDLLPINNDDNYMKALTTAKPLLRVLLQKRGDGYLEINGFGTLQKKKGPLAKIIAAEPKPRSHVPISLPGDFRRVSAIIDVDVIPETHRRVKLMKNGSDKPLGFYIRDGTSMRVSPHGLEKVQAIFISRLVPGGLAESTGLLAVNDEVLEVNGIEVAGKTLDQVTDMMVANSSNLIVTVKPVNQRNNILPYRGGSGRMSQKSTGSHASAQSTTPSFGSDEVRDLIHEEDDDLVKDHMMAPDQSEPANVSSSTNQSVSTTSDSEPAPTSSTMNNGEKAKEANASKKDKDKDSAVITF